jgi:hypothetical protein
MTYFIYHPPITTPLQRKYLTPAEKNTELATKVNFGPGLDELAKKAVPAAAVKPYSSSHIISAL